MFILYNGSHVDNIYVAVRIEHALFKMRRLFRITVGNAEEFSRILEQKNLCKITNKTGAVVKDFCLIYGSELAE